MNKKQEQIDNIIMQMVAGKVYVDDAQLHQYMLEMGLDDFDIELLE